MKKLVYLLFVTVSLSVKSQITLESTPPIIGGLYEGFSTSNLGDKYIVWKNNNDTVTIYNSNWSLYRTTILPTGYSYYPFFSYVYNEIPSVSDNLFNSDSLLEFVISKQTGTDPYNYIVSIINELGQIQYTFPDSVYEGSLNIHKSDGVFKVSYLVYVTGLSHQNMVNRIYTLPGTLPCNQCNSLPSGIVDPNQGGGFSGLNVYPNPFNNNLEINYNFLSKQDNQRIIITDILGRELKSIPLTNQSDKITINTTDLPRGTMIISLYGNGQNPVSKKVIKIN